MPRLTPVAALLALTLPAAALSATADDLLARLDQNGDAAISQGEFLALREAMFVRMDADASDTLTRAEIAAALEAMPQGQRPPADDRVWAQDANGDGQLTLAEYTAQTRGFDRADRNGDGFLAGAELDRVARMIGPWLGALN